MVVDSDEQFYDCEEAHLHPDAAASTSGEGGGISCRDQALIAAQRSIILDVAKQLGRKLLTGNLDLINITLPVVMFEPRSYLQKLADPWRHPWHLQRAAQCTTDPLERMKATMTWFVAGMQHVFASWRKCFNPICGETWQACLSDGTMIYLEQLSHHPPVTAFSMEHPSGLYRFDGLSQPDASFKGNSIKTSAKGYRRITFQDGTVISIAYPWYELHGILYSSQAPTGLLKGTATFTDTCNGLTGEMRFGAVDGAAKGSLLARSDAFTASIHKQQPGGADTAADGSTFSISSSSCSKTDARAAAGRRTRSTGTLQANVSSGGGSSTGGAAGKLKMPKSSPASPKATGSSRKLGFSSMFKSQGSSQSKHGAGAAGPQRTLVCSGSGSWLSHLDFGGSRYWTLLEESPDEWRPLPGPALPSDCQSREDLVALAAGDVDGAQRLKKDMEERQRADAKLRPKFPRVGAS